MAKRAAATTIKKIPAAALHQGKHTFYLFTLRASELYKLVQVNRRLEDKREGYQRSLSPSRVRAVARYIQSGGVIPGSIVVSFDNGNYSEATHELILEGDENIGWVIDGQHRLTGAFEASESNYDTDLAVIGFLDANIETQIDLFITINREAKGVPSSLYIDLLKDLPRKKTDKEFTDERVADIARRINADETSPFFQRIIFTRTAKVGELSLVNFARVLRSYVARPSGILSLYTQLEQEGAINNYYSAVAASFPRAFEKNIFFRTIGFGGAWRAFPLVLTLSLTRQKSFSVSSISKIFKEIRGFDFDLWT